MKTANKTNRYGGETADNESRLPRVLLYDLESSPNLAYIWGKYEQDALGDMVKERQIISIAWKWLGAKEIHCRALPDFPSYKSDPENNADLAAHIYALFSQADIVVGHNVKNFDDKRANTDFIKHGFRPPPPHRQVDTLQVARDKFDFNSNRLDDLGAFLKLGRKVRHAGFPLWQRCMKGEPKAWAEMKAYNIGDVRLLERIYLKLRPWMTNHPSMVALDFKEGCPSCRSKNLKRQGFQLVQSVKRQRFVCADCGRWCNGTRKWDGWRFF